MYFFKIDISSTFEDVDIAVDRILNFLKYRCSINDECFIFKTNFILRELMINAVEHGNKMDMNKRVSCIVTYSEAELKIDVSDEGEGFIYKSEFTDMYGEDVISHRGRGIFTILKMGADVKFVKNHVYAKLNF